ncbi:hypothetical protein [Enterovirga sp. CN4-39]|uniref:hypothetical protein n=1 Tax=Enterovirga sp. CN4-39 TaxID=3400910 RepID=UPI003BFDC6C1
MATRVRLAKAADFVRAFGREPPAKVWFGMVAETDGEPVGFGTVVWDEYGRAWGAFDRIGPVSAFTMHKTAQTVMGWLARTGQSALYVQCSETIPGAQFWLERLGFHHEADGIWVKCLTT